MAAAAEEEALELLARARAEEEQRAREPRRVRYAPSRRKGESPSGAKTRSSMCDDARSVYLWWW